MAALNAPDSERPVAGFIAGIGRRLAGAAWVLGALGLLLILLAAAGVVSPLGAAIAFAGIVAALALLPQGGAEDGPALTLPAAPAEALDPAFGSLAEALPEPCFILDRRGIVRYANRRTAAVFPVRAGETLTHRLRAPDLVAALERVARGGAPERIEFAERVPTERWFGAWFAPIGSNADLIALILEDLSERRRMDKVRVDFVANASHELRTPLASLAGFIETLQGPARDDTPARERFLAIMHEQATRMSRLVDDLLSLSRVEMKAHLRPSDAVDLGGTVSHVVDSLEPLARELGVVIEADLPDEPVVIAGDRDELIQVFGNLVENACKYGQSGKRVVVSMRAGDGASGPSVSIRDFGPGIGEEHLPRLTERFYRVDMDQSARHRGTGLGLAIAKHILARHRARLTIDSRLGEGSLFTVTFPPQEPGPAENSQVIPAK